MHLLNSLARRVLGGLSDRRFSELQYFRRQFRWPDLDDPLSFNEQILWIKVNYRDPLLHICADKLLARGYVEQAGCGENLIPLVGTFADPEGINFSELPERFVLKASHGSGMNLLCRDNRTLDPFRARTQLRRWLSTDFYQVGREWAYQGLSPSLVCEQFLSDESGEPPRDYKFHCFLGEPRYVQVDYGRFVHHTRAIYDAAWNRLLCRLEYRLEPSNQPAPRHLEEMLTIARRLSSPFPYVRVDLYEVGGQVYFGELTFYPGKGVERFSPWRFDVEWGQWLAGKLKGSLSANRT